MTEPIFRLNKKHWRPAICPFQLSPTFVNLHRRFQSFFQNSSTLWGDLIAECVLASASFLAEISVSSPCKLRFFHYLNILFLDTSIQKVIMKFWKQKHSWPWSVRRTVTYAYVLGRGRTPDFLNLRIPIPKKCDLK